jgi:hypothetical protein
MATVLEVLFHLALTFGLEDDAVLALERAIGGGGRTPIPT